MLMSQEFDLTNLLPIDKRAQFKKPLRPIWLTQESDLFKQIPEFQDFYSLILCTASRRVFSGEGDKRCSGGVEYTYIQGAGDDSESWSLVSHIS